jgi:hypothetical protein
MKVSIAVATLLICSVVNAKSNSMPTLTQIMKNAPELNREHAIRVAAAVDSVSKRYSIPAKVYAAILMQESRYNVSAKNCKSGLKFLDEQDRHANFAACFFKKYTDGPVVAYKACVPELKKTTKSQEICTDIGMSQIHINTIHAYQFDVHRLSTDIEYSIEAGAKVLSFFKKQYSKSEKNWWSRYNTSASGPRATYERLVNRFIK